MTVSLGLNDDPPAWIRKGHMAGVPRGTLAWRNRLELFQQKLVVTAVGGARAGESSGEDAGCAIECGNTQPRIFPQYPAPKLLGLLGRFEDCIGGEAVPCLFDIKGIGEVFEVQDLNRVRLQQLAEFQPFLLIVCAENQGEIL